MVVWISSAVLGMVEIMTKLTIAYSKDTELVFALPARRGGQPALERAE